MKPRPLIDIARAIAQRDPSVPGLLRGSPSLATDVVRRGATRAAATEFFFDEIRHYVYDGDTLLHVAAATHATEIVKMLLAAGADPRARNRRGAEPLHYAADGAPGDFDAQAKVVTLLLQAGADANAFDKSGVAPLHRAVRNRCTGAVRALLAGGADRQLPNKSGSKPLDLARLTTGKSGSGSEAAKEAQTAIIALLTAKA